MKRGPLKAGVSIAALGASMLSLSLSAAVIEVGDLNEIDDAANASNGLYYLDFSYGAGQSENDAIIAAKAVYSDSRLATPAEWDDLFSAAGISYTGSLVASDAFNPGGSERIVSGDSNAGALVTLLADATTRSIRLWSEPDGSSGTRDFILISSTYADIRHDSRVPPLSDSWGWLIVTEQGPASVPSPSTLTLLGILLPLGLPLAVRAARQRRAA